jgi:CRP-like cAMP-binding protein
VVDTDVLRALPLFASVANAELERIARWFEPRSLSAGVELAGEGAPGYSFYVLTDGAASVTSGDDTIAWLEPGDFFGEGAIIGDGRRHATVTITVPSEVLVIFGTEFRRLQLAHPEIAAAIDKVARDRL